MVDTIKHITNACCLPGLLTYLHTWARGSTTNLTGTRAARAVVSGGLSMWCRGTARPCAVWCLSRNACKVYYTLRRIMGLSSDQCMQAPTAGAAIDSEHQGQERRPVLLAIASRQMLQ